MSEQVDRYRVEPTGCGFWPFRVVAGNGARALFIGNRGSCERVAAELTTAYRDGEFVGKQDYDALHAEAEALRAEIEELDSLRNRQSDLLSQTAIALRGPEPALTRYSHADIPSRVKTVVADLEVARGLLERLTAAHDCTALNEARAFLTATPAPEVPDHTERNLEMAEQGERQEAFVWMRPDGDESFELTSEGDYLSFPLYKAQQPSPDVRELVEALEECAASLAWNCFGECRAIHAGPIMPAAMALDTARAALATYHQDT